MGGEFGGEWIHIYVWLSPPFAVLLKLSQHGLLIGYMPIQNKKFKKKRAMFLVSALELNRRRRKKAFRGINTSSFRTKKQIFSPTKSLVSSWLTFNNDICFRKCLWKDG